MPRGKKKNSVNSATQLKIPAISVIIPMYNAEKYIGECLDSLLAQTFGNFEVIVADDCSTDKSAMIVERYAKKFSERLTLTSTKTNSGGGGVPRNKGLSFSRGEYVFFMDADDALTATGLEEMYTLAKNYDADVVYCEKYYVSTGAGQDFMNNIRVADRNIQTGGFISEPTLETNNLSERVKKAVSWGYWVTPWQRLVSRKLLTENEISFPSLIGSNDVPWCFEVLFCAKRFLRVPNLCYIWRMHEESNTLRKRPLDNLVHKWLDRTIRGLKIIDDFMAKMRYFKDNPQERYAILAFFTDSDFNSIFPASLNVQPSVFYEIIRKEFKDEFGEHDVLISTLCAVLNTYQRIVRDNVKKYKQASDKAGKRIAELEAILKSKGAI